MFSLSEAAKQTCQSKSTIWRAIKSGRISATRTDTGEFQIDPAELYRVFPARTASERATTVSVKQDAMPETATETVLLRAEINSLRQMGEMLRSQLEDVKQDRDAWRGQAQAGTVLLTHAAPSPPKTGWLRRLVGVV